MIGCVLVSFFAAAVEQRDNPSLAGVPLVISEPSADVESVFAVSSEAARMGVEAGMLVRQARALCPQAHILPADRIRYQRAFEALLEVLTRFTPSAESGGSHPAAIGYLDLGQMEQAEAIEMARCIGQTVRAEVRVEPAIGLAGGKFPAYVAAASLEPSKALLVAPGREAAFLAPFPVDVLSLDEETAHRLRLLGIRTMGQLAALPASAVLSQFGVQGRRLHQLACGCDERPMLPRRPETMESISRQLDGPVADRIVLEAVACAMAGELAGRLQARGLMARKLRLILHLEDEAAHEKQVVMRQPTNVPERLGLVLGELIARAEVRFGVTGLELILADLTPARGQQLDLFVHQTGQEGRLRKVLKDLVARYGADCFYSVSLPDRAACLPERRFRLQEMEAQ